jgi:hypothetical protein
MDLPNQPRSATSMFRQISSLKLVSRLLGHELHSQSSAKAITLSRESVLEIQNTLDLFIEESSRGQLGVQSPTGAAAVTTRMVSSTNSN